MVTGDAEATAEKVAKELGISDVVAGVKPDGKVAAVEKLQAQHGKLIFVGDGINDAPALAPQTLVLPLEQVQTWRSKVLM